MILMTQLSLIVLLDYDATNPGALQIILVNFTVINGAVTAIVVTNLGLDMTLQILLHLL